MSPTEKYSMAKKLDAWQLKYFSAGMSKLEGLIENRVGYILVYIGNAMGGSLKYFDIKDDIYNIYKCDVLKINADWYGEPLNWGTLLFPDGTNICISREFPTRFLFEDFEEEVDRAIEYTKKAVGEKEANRLEENVRKEKLSKLLKKLEAIISSLSDEKLDSIMKVIED